MKRSTVYKVSILVCCTAVFVAFQNFTAKAPAPKDPWDKLAVDKGDCFLENEIDDRVKKLQRVTVMGCEAPVVVPQATLDIRGPYGKDGTIFACKNVRSDTFSMLPVSQGFKELLEVSDSLAKTPNDSAKVQCITNTLLLWARSQAITRDKSTDSQNDYARIWTVGSLASVYLKHSAVRKLAQVEKKEAEILDWFSNQADNIVEFRFPSFGNIYFWRGFAVTALGIVLSDAELVSEGRKIGNFALEQIQGGDDVFDKGWIETELARGQKAFHYHHFALQPILGMMNLTKAINCGFVKTEKQEIRLSALVRKLIEGYNDHSVFSRKTGIEQSGYYKTEGLLSLMGNDEQSTRITSRVRHYLKTRGMTMLDGNPYNSKNLGGRVDSMPAAGSIVPSASIQKFCKANR